MIIRATSQSEVVVAPLAADRVLDWRPASGLTPRSEKVTRAAWERDSGRSDVTAELVLLCTHTIIVDFGLRADDESVSAVVEVLAERRAEFARELDVHTAIDASKADLRGLREKGEATERTIDWLIDAELAPDPAA